MGLVRAIFRRRHLEETLGDEVQRHIDLLTDEYVHAGMPPEEARRAATRRFGSVSSIEERCREQNGTARVETLWQDVRFGVRSFALQPGFTAVLLATLALGIGANTAVFSVLRAVLLEPLPLPQPDRVVLVWEHDRLRGTARESASYPDFLDLKQRCRRFEYLAAAQPMNVTLTGSGEPERVRAERVTSEYFRVLGLEPVIGRVFRPGEAGIILSHSLWVRKFDSVREVLGRAVHLDGFSGTVLGVMPPAASSLTQPAPELWTALESVRATQFRGQHSTRILGRLRRDADVEQAQAEVSGIMASLEKEYPRENLGRGATVVPLHEELAGNMRPALTALSITVAVLLLIACVNLANLLLARGSARGREMAIRMSLGAGRWRLVRQLLTESLLLALAGAVTAMLVGWWGVRGLIALAPPNTPLIGLTTIDLGTFAVTLMTSVAAWLLFGLLPALRASVAPPAGALQSSSRSSPSRGSLRLRHALIIAQVAMAAVLVIFSGLLIRSFWRLRHVNVGYEPRGVITLRVKLPETRYPFPQFPFREWPAVAAFNERLKTAASELPGVQATSIAMASPARSAWTTRVTVVGRPAPPEGEQDEAEFRTADPNYLNVTRARLLRGRFFSESDDERHPLTAVVNEAFVRRHFPGEAPLGRQIAVFGLPRQIVGVIADMRYGGPASAPAPAMYFPVRQAPFPDLTLLVRTAGDPAALAQSLRRAVFASDASVAAFDVMTLERALLEATARERFVMSLLTGFAAVALTLAGIGIYGVVAYAVGRRRQEIAVRLALGARARDVVAQTVSGAMLRTAVGASVGVLIAIFAGRILKPLVFEISTRDVPTYAVVGSVVMAIAFVGAALPARRATHVNPAAALREE